MMRPCPSCNLPVAYDALGNTDHVCFTLNAAQRHVLELIDRKLETGEPVRIVIESTAGGGVRDWFWRRWQQRAVLDGALYGHAFLPWFTNEAEDDDDD